MENNKIIIPKLPTEQLNKIDLSIVKQILDELEGKALQLKQLEELQASLMMEIATLKMGGGL